MGSFSYTCQLSGLPITSGTPCAILLMLPREDFYDNGEAHFRKYGKSTFVSNEGVNVFFNELAFPIFGEYDDYGGLENIVEDDNTKCLEEYFELSIEEICELVCSYSREDNDILKKKNAKHALLLKASCAWYHAEFYNQLAQKPSTAWKDSLDLGVPGLLKKLGFKPTNVKNPSKDKHDADRYNEAYEKDGLTLFSDGNWIHVAGRESIYSLKDLQKYCAKQGVTIDISELDKMSRHEQIYECILPEIEDLKGGDRWQTERVIYLLLGDEHGIRMGHRSTEELTLRLIEHSIKALEKGENPIFKVEDSLEDLKKQAEKLKKLIKKQTPYPKISLTEFYFDKIKSEGNGFLKSNIVAWQKVKGFYYPLGRYLYPIGTSPQDGDREGVKTVLETALNVLNAEMKERGYYEEEEEFETE